MALMSGSLYDALRSANVDDDRARHAAEEVATFQNQNNDLKLDLAAVKGDVALVKWMLGFVLASNVALLLGLQLRLS
jgi:hypothetical protein